MSFLITRTSHSDNASSYFQPRHFNPTNKAPDNYFIAAKASNLHDES